MNRTDGRRRGRAAQAAADRDHRAGRPRTQRREMPQPPLAVEVRRSKSVGRRWHLRRRGFQQSSVHHGRRGLHHGVRQSSPSRANVLRLFLTGLELTPGYNADTSVDWMSLMRQRSEALEGRGSAARKRLSLANNSNLA